MRKILIITGHKIDETQVKQSIVTRDSFLHTTLNFPEAYKHPRDTVKKVKEAIDELQGANLVIITYSEAVINYIGHLIYYGKISHEGIEVDVYDEDGSICKAKYDREGILEGDWPFGFFEWDPED